MKVIPKKLRKYAPPLRFSNVRSSSYYRVRNSLMKCTTIYIVLYELNLEREKPGYPEKNLRSTGEINYEGNPHETRPYLALVDAQCANCMCSPCFPVC